MKCILKTNSVTGNMRGATLHTTPIELLTILEALRIYEYERDNPIDKATVRQMLKDLANREVETDRKTEPQVVMPKECKGCDSASKIIEAYTRGFEDGADAVKAMPQTERIE